MEIKSSIQDELFQMEQRLLHPEVRTSKGDLMVILADDFVEFGSSGRIFYKQQIIEDLINSHTPQMEIKDFQAIPLASDIVLTTFRVVKHIKPEGEEIKNSLRSSIWKFIDDRWQIVFHQGTPIVNI